MRTETKANDVTIRRYEVDDLPKTAKNGYPYKQFQPLISDTRKFLVKI